MYKVEIVCYKYKIKCLNFYFIIKVDFEEDLFDKIKDDLFCVI